MYIYIYIYILQGAHKVGGDCRPAGAAQGASAQRASAGGWAGNIYIVKETYSYEKRDLFIWQKRPIHMKKETYSYGKRGLFIWQKRPIKICWRMGW